jgi:hypothetical protein
VYATALVILGVTTSSGYHEWLIHPHDAYVVTGVARYMPLATVVLPLLLGMFWGAPLFAKEYEENTNKFVWTQGVSRKKWFAVKLVWMLGFAALFGLVMSLASAWSLKTEHLLMYNHFQWTHFDVHGVVPVVYAMFAVALGAAIGAWKRKVLASLGITMVIFVGFQGIMALYLRGHIYTKPLHSRITTYHRGYDDLLPAGLNGAIIGQKVEGRPVELDSPIWVLGQKTQYTPDCPKDTSLEKQSACPAHETQEVVYHPANRFWLFQLVESSLYLVLTAGLVICARRLILRRDA